MNALFANLMNRQRILGGYVNIIIFFGKKKKKKNVNLFLIRFFPRPYYTGILQFLYMLIRTPTTVRALTFFSLKRCLQLPTTNRFEHWRRRAYYTFLEHRTVNVGTAGSQSPRRHPKEILLKYVCDSIAVSSALCFPGTRDRQGGGRTGIVLGTYTVVRPIENGKPPAGASIVCKTYRPAVYAYILT